ncbi:hypothetical protein VMCG_07108 [Cytospora schulzeri]|uniref:Uncharacterized protein n=1 Tax=Cytospora schulzeri TaxID=448051 RepID=A0A423W525_9PEZI|nr:hypothetical protein VMCG_07108 [Valsa malicola]
MASFFDLTRPHLAYYSVPAALLLTMAPHVYAGLTAGKSFDIAYPRKTIDTIDKDTSLDKQTALRIQRAEAASSNGFESLGLYASGIAAAASAGVPSESLSYLSAGYLASRVVYNAVYVFLQDDKRLAPLRSFAWDVSVGIMITIWVKAGNRAFVSLPFPTSPSRHARHTRAEQCEHVNRAPRSCTRHAMQPTGWLSFRDGVSTACPPKQSSWVSLRGGAGIVPENYRQAENHTQTRRRQALHDQQTQDDEANPTAAPRGQQQQKKG